MNNTSFEIFKELNELLSIIPCSKCNMKLHNSRQFLRCGHTICTTCIEYNNAACCHCRTFIKTDDIETIKNIERIIQLCCNVAEKFGFKKTVENIEKNLKCVSLKENTDNSSDVVVNPMNLDFNNSKISNYIYNTCDDNDLHEFKHKVIKKSKKRKKNVKFSNENLKKTKYSNNLSKFSIPKNINKKNHHGETKLQEECKKGRKDNVKILLNLGADPNTHCNANWTPLQESADFGFYDIAKLLLKSGANVNQLGYDCRTALHEAAKNNNLDMIKLLLKYKAKTDILDKYGKKAIDYCKFGEIKELLNSKANSIKNYDENNQSNNYFMNTNFINTNNLNEIISNNVPMKKEIKNIDSEQISKNDTNDSDLENEIKIVFENVKNNNIINNINNLIETKDNIIVSKTIQEMEVESKHDSEKTIHEYCFKDFKNISYDSKYISFISSVNNINNESDEYIDIIN